MILSSTDILEVLRSSKTLTLIADITIVDGKPGPTGSERIRIYVNRYPALQEFEATWQIWIEGEDDLDIVIAELQRLLPRTQVTRGLLVAVSTTEFRSDSTQKAPEAPKVVQAQVDLKQYEERFQGLVEDVQDRMLLVNSGQAGKDGRDGVNGRDGRDGRDIDATETSLFDLKDAGQSRLPLQKGQVLTYDGFEWTNLYVRQTTTISGGGSPSGGTQGVSSTIAWTYHPHDHTEEPGSGHFHTDSADGELVTVFHVSDSTSRSNNVEVLLRDLLLQGYDRIYVALSDDLSQAHLYSITGSTETATGFEINVSHIETAGLEPDYQNAKTYEFLFTKSATGGVGIPEAPSDGNYYVRQNGSWVLLTDALTALNVTWS